MNLSRPYPVHFLICAERFDVSGAVPRTAPLLPCLQSCDCFHWPRAGWGVGFECRNRPGLGTRKGQVAVGQCCFRAIKRGYFQLLQILSIGSNVPDPFMCVVFLSWGMCFIDDLCEVCSDLVSELEILSVGS